MDIEELAIPLLILVNLLIALVAFLAIGTFFGNALGTLFGDALGGFWVNFIIGGIGALILVKVLPFISSFVAIYATITEWGWYWPISVIVFFYPIFLVLSLAAPTIYSWLSSKFKRRY